jgi:hypothetical protein
MGAVVRQTLTGEAVRAAVPTVHQKVLELTPQVEALTRVAEPREGTAGRRVEVGELLSELEAT